VVAEPITKFDPSGKATILSYNVPEPTSYCGRNIIALDVDNPNSGTSCRIVRFVRQYAATSRARSSSGRLHGRPLRAASAPSRRSTVTSLAKARGLSPVKGAIQDGCDAVITPATSRSSHWAGSSLHRASAAQRNSWTS